MVDEIIAQLSKLPGVKNLIPAGSLRRFRETVGDIDLMGFADDTTLLAVLQDSLIRGEPEPVARSMISPAGVTPP